jgi:AcrR family transcriptional regulator
MVSTLDQPVSKRPPRRATRRQVREVVAEFRRASILDAAREVFARHGFVGTTMDLIAGAAGVAKGTLYLYYPSKESIYLAAVLEGLRALANETAAVLESGGDIRTMLRAFFVVRLRYFEERVDFFRIHTAEVEHLGRAATKIRQEYDRRYETQVTLLERALAAAAQAGDIGAVDARTVATAIFDLSHGLIVRHLRAVAATPRPDVEAVLDLLWKGIEAR